MKRFLIILLLLVSCVEEKVEKKEITLEDKIEEVINVIETYNEQEQGALYGIFIKVDDTNTNGSILLSFRYYNLDCNENKTILFNYKEMCRLSLMEDEVYSALGETMKKLYLYAIQEHFGYDRDNQIIIPEKKYKNSDKIKI